MSTTTVEPGIDDLTDAQRDEAGLTFNQEPVTPEAPATPSPNAAAPTAPKPAQAQGKPEKDKEKQKPGTVTMADKLSSQNLILGLLELVFPGISEKFGKGGDPVMNQARAVISDLVGSFKNLPENSTAEDIAERVRISLKNGLEKNGITMSPEKLNKFLDHVDERLARSTDHRGEISKAVFVDQLFEEAKSLGFDIKMHVAGDPPAATAMKRPPNLEFSEPVTINAGNFKNAGFKPNESGMIEVHKFEPSGALDADPGHIKADELLKSMGGEFKIQSYHAKGAPATQIDGYIVTNAKGDSYVMNGTALDKEGWDKIPGMRTAMQTVEKPAEPKPDENKPKPEENLTLNTTRTAAAFEAGMTAFTPSGMA